MTFEEDLSYFLRHNSSITAVAGTSIWNDMIPETATRPLVLWTMIDRPRFQSLEPGRGQLPHPRIQIDSLAPSKPLVLQLSRAVYLALDGFRGELKPGGQYIQNCELIDEQSLYDPVGLDFRVIQDYIFWYMEN